MKKMICDKCGKELRNDEVCELTVDGNAEEYFDLCPDCMEKLIDWLSGSCPCQKQAETAHVAPAKKKGAKKEWWKLSELCDRFGRKRSAVGTVLSGGWVERRKQRDSKTHWWYEYKLDEAKMAELQKRFKGGKK